MYDQNVVLHILYMKASLQEPYSIDISHDGLIERSSKQRFQLPIRTYAPSFISGDIIAYLELELDCTLRVGYYQRIIIYTA